ncbi:Hypothetical Protein FCC1311_100402 [Hondaea fermentalgiana]|uniref:Uncharacterized protein n=1 Tax=Hondaea fermentalgiana TaxID=2315210 RepID=A0A2R5GSF8_9STRA|nr:Hypothetical Protein FCC1311_100402 [Hondaea fermentalgiana]|eukprot:GBG33817.1 Hypothetical Protein FCC1311_100402 [Hondaea fermentalgiana]
MIATVVAQIDIQDVVTLQKERVMKLAKVLITATTIDIGVAILAISYPPDSSSERFHMAFIDMLPYPTLYFHILTIVYPVSAVVGIMQQKTYYLRVASIGSAFTLGIAALSAAQTLLNLTIYQAYEISLPDAPGATIALNIFIFIFNIFMVILWGAHMRAVSKLLKTSRTAVFNERSIDSTNVPKAEIVKVEYVQRAPV